MKYLVIGGSSFIGAYTIHELLDRGFEVVATGRNPKFKEYYKNLGVPYEIVDINNIDSFSNIENGIYDGVVSLAARMPANVAKDNNIEDLGEYISTNVLGTVNILEWCRKRGINRLVDIISRFDCRLYSADKVITEETPLLFSYEDDHAAYVLSNKQKAEVLDYYNKRYGMKNIWLRIPSVYGVGPHGSFAKDGVMRRSGLQIFMDKATRGETITVFGDPQTPKDVLYVKDMALAIANALESEHGTGLYNVAYDENFTIFDLARATAEAFASNGIKSDVVSDPNISNNGAFPRMSNRKIKTELGFCPKYGDPYKMMVDYYEELQRGEYAKLFS